METSRSGGLIGCVLEILHSELKCRFTDKVSTPALFSRAHSGDCFCDVTNHMLYFTEQKLK